MQINPIIFRYFDGDYFEQLVMEIYTYYGYDIVKTAITGDQGVDLIMTKGDEKVAVQCKRYKKNVNNKAIQEVFAGMHYYGCNKSMVVTSSSYTHGGRNLASALNVQLIDCEKLADILSSNNNFIGENFYKNPDLTQILINACHDLMEHGEYLEAIDVLSEIIKEKENLLKGSEQDILNAYNYLARCYRGIGDNQKAAQIFNEGLLIQRYPDILNNLAVLYRDLGRYRDAKYLLDEINVDPDTYYHTFVQNHKLDLEQLAVLKDQLIAGSISRNVFNEAEDSILKKYR